MNKNIYYLYFYILFKSRSDFCINNTKSRLSFANINNKLK